MTLAPVEKDCGRCQVPDEHDARPVDAEELERAGHCRPVTLREVAEYLVVAGLTAKGVDGADPAQRLGEVNDHECHGISRVAVGDRRLALVPPRQEEERYEAREADEPEGEVQDEEDDADADDREHRIDEGVEPKGEHVVDRLEVRGKARDHPPSRVALVESKAQALELGEDPFPELEEDLLAHLARAGDEHPVQDGLRDGTDDDKCRDDEQGGVVAVAYSDHAAVDPHPHEVGNGRAGKVGDKNGGRDPQDRPPVWRGEGTEQAAGTSP